MSAAAKKIVVEPAVSAPVMDVARPEAAASIDSALLKIVAATKSSPLKIMREYTALAFGPGKVSFAEYTKLRLFDDAYYAGNDKRAVLGWKRISQIHFIANYRYDWWGMLSDKVASASYLKAYGFRTIPILAIYSERAGRNANNLLNNIDSLRGFLTNESLYPMFGKPAQGLQSLGSIALKRFDPAQRMLETMDGRFVPLEDFLENIARHYSDGYVFQMFGVPHPAVRAICGDRIATVRIVTIMIDGEPRLFRACWKVPTGGNMADNFWRPGNMLAKIDLDKGKVVRAISGAGLELIEHERHPDTGAQLKGCDVPLWPELLKLALEGAKLMQHVAMIGWDMAALEGGPMIIEMNERPDLFLNQLADGRGVLDNELNGFLAQQKNNRIEREKFVIEQDKH